MPVKKPSLGLAADMPLVYNDGTPFSGALMPSSANRIDVDPPAKDRRISLALIGSLDLLIALVCLLFVALFVLGYTASQSSGKPPAMQPGAVVLFSGMYLGIAVLAGTVGIGLWQCLRWARSLALAGSWMWLAVGVLASGFMAFILPDILSQQMARPGVSPAIATIVTWIIVGMLMVMYILIPGVHVLVLGHANVRDTCAFRDPKVRWTDAVPLPILILCLFHGAAAFGMLSILAYGVFPFFGVMLTGVPVWVLCLVCAVALAWVTREMYCLRLTGWWGGLGFMLAMWTSSAITFSFHSIMDMYQAMNMPEEQLALMKSLPFFQGHFMVYAMLAGAVPYVAHMAFCRKYFVAKG
jgi:hypothetical protein